MNLYATIEDIMTSSLNRGRWVGYKELRALCEGQEDYGSNIPKKAFIDTADSISLLNHKGIIFHKWRFIPSNEKKAIIFDKEE